MLEYPVTVEGTLPVKTVDMVPKAAETTPESL